MGTLKGFALLFGSPPAHHPTLASPFGDFGTCTFPTTPARYARALALGLAKPAMVRRAQRWRRGRAKGGVGCLSRSPRRGSRRAPHASHSCRGATGE
jgi:hypothetical protein